MACHPGSCPPLTSGPCCCCCCWAWTAFLLQPPPGCRHRHCHLCTAAEGAAAVLTAASAAGLFARRLALHLQMEQLLVLVVLPLKALPCGFDVIELWWCWVWLCAHVVPAVCVVLQGPRSVPAVLPALLLDSVRCWLLLAFAVLLLAAESHAKVCAQWLCGCTCLAPTHSTCSSIDEPAANTYSTWLQTPSGQSPVRAHACLVAGQRLTKQPGAQVPYKGFTCALEAMAAPLGPAAAVCAGPGWPQAAAAGARRQPAAGQRDPSWATWRVGLQAAVTALLPGCWHSFPGAGPGAASATACPQSCAPGHSHLQAGWLLLRSMLHLLCNMASRPLTA